MDTAYCKIQTYLVVSYQVNIHGLYDSEIPLLGIFSGEIKTYAHKKIVHEYL